VFHERLPYVCCAARQDQMFVNRGPPSQAAEIEIASPANEIGGRWPGSGCVCVSAQRVKAQVLTRGYVVTEFYICIVKRDIGEIRPNPAANQPADIALPKRCTPVWGRHELASVLESIQVANRMRGLS